MSIAKMFEAGRMAAREDQERSALARHLQSALGGDKAALGQIYSAAPDTGMKVEGLAQQRAQGASEAARKRLADLSTLATRAPHMAAQVYPQWRAALEATGLASGLPEQYEEGAMQAMQAFATQANDGTPSAIRELQMLQANPELAKLDMQRRQAGWRPQVLTTDQGFAAYDPRTNGVSPLSYGQPQPSNMQYQTEDGQPVPPEDMAAFTAAATQGGTFAVGPGGKSVPVSLPAMGAFGGPPRVKPPGKASDAPNGYRWSADGSQLEAIPGGPADPSTPKALPPAQAAKREEARRKEARLLTSATAEFDETIALIDDILKREGDFGGVTGMGALGARIPGTDWADLDNKLETLRARSAFGSLQEMRANSPTGGALGSVTERELGLLQNAEAQLGTKQSPRALKESLQAYRRVIEGSKRRLREGFGEFYQDAPAAQPSAGASGGWSIKVKP